MNELQRAVYLLKVKYKIDIDCEGGAEHHDPDFIERVFETRMEIEASDTEESLYAIQTDLLT